MGDNGNSKKTIGTRKVKVETVTLGGETSGLEPDSLSNSSSTSITRSVTEKMLRTSGLSDKYVFIDEIGRGGMGSVLRVYDSNLRRHVAMKRILASTGERTRLRFIEEAQITGQLEHPHIVPVHEIGKDVNGRFYFTMKLIRGETLHSILEKLREDDESSDRYTLGHLLHAFINVCHAIDFAHSRGVIHRDIKPENIMLGQFGEVQVMDWGLAKAQHVAKEATTEEHVRDAVTVEEHHMDVAVDPEEELKPVDSVRDENVEDGITIDGQILGTLSYMSPEQARGDNDRVDRRSDIYTLGAILYEIITLHTPVQAKTNDEMIRNICRGKILPPSERAPDRSVPKELEAIAMKALARVPELRYQSVYELRKDVELYLSGRSVSAKKDSFFESFTKLILRNKALSLVVAVSLIAIIILGIYTARERTKAKESERNFEELAKETDEATRREWVEVHPEQFDIEQLSQNWDLYTDWSIPPKPVAESEWPRYLSPDSDGMHVRTDKNPLTILYRKPIVGDVKLTYEVTWLGGDEGGFHAILNGNGWHEGYIFQIGGWHNTKTRLLHADSDGQKILDESDFTLTPGTTYVIEASKVGNALHLTINGRLILHAVEDPDDVLAGGPYSHCGFISGNNAESVYRRVTISKLGESIRVDMLDVADRYMLKARYQTARDLYQEVFESFSSSERRQRALTGVERATELLELERSLEDYRQMLSKTWQGIDPKLWIEHKALQLDLRGQDIDTLEPLRGMSLQRLNISRCSRLESIDPLDGMPLMKFDASGTGIKNIAPLRKAPLKHLVLDDSNVNRGWNVLRLLPLEHLSIRGLNIRHLSALKDNNTLRELYISRCGIRDLSPLVGAPLHILEAAHNPISETDVLAVLPLRRLDLSHTRIADLEVMRRMPQLQQLSVAGTAITDLTPLINCDLFALNIADTKVEDLSPVKIQYITDLQIQDTPISDLTPLADMQLQRLRFSPFNIESGMDILRQMQSLEFIGIGDAPVQPADEFWEWWDLQEMAVPEFEEGMEPEE